MKKYILIQNEGEIETNSFELIGASTKRNDNSKIGFFGSGLKYSIAFMMRSGIDFKIFSGLNEVLFTTKDETLKEQTFQRICINGVPTSYTTTMGPTWEHQWFVLREIYCNAIDEGTCQMVKETTNVNAEQGKTRIYIELTDNLQSVIKDWDNYFCDERTPMFIAKSIYTCYLSGKESFNDVSIYKKSKGSLFRKGIMVGTNEKYSFDYEMMHIDINEDRTAKHIDAISYAFANMAATLCNESWVCAILRNTECREYTALRTSNLHNPISEDWIKFSDDYLLYIKEISGKYSEKILSSPKEAFPVPQSFAFELKKSFPEIKILGMGRMIGEYSVEEVEPTNKMKFLLKEVETSLKEMGYEVPYNIKFAEFSNPDIMGKADIDIKTIFISPSTFDKGRREIAMTLMEECEHIKSGAGDETREFQTHIFSKWLSYMEEKSALFL